MSCKVVTVREDLFDLDIDSVQMKIIDFTNCEVIYEISEKCIIKSR